MNSTPIEWTDRPLPPEYVDYLRARLILEDGSRNSEAGELMCRASEHLRNTWIAEREWNEFPEVER